MKVDFEVDDGIRKLREFNLLVAKDVGDTGERYGVVQPREALRMLDEKWDKLFTYAK